MYKENLFELIRKENVIVWAGAGMSLYAGFPSGKELCEILLQNLNPREKEIINPHLSLPELAEEFYRIKGSNKNELIRILNDTFLKPANSSNTHDKIAIIPHFKTIITTNYDSLFEDAYKNKAQLIFNSKHIPYIDNKKVQIFKVHGCLSEPDSIILTKSDYNNFFKDNYDANTYWSVIRERLATNSVLFLGYNIEDPNISVIFDRITDSLSDNKKESFLVAPNLPEHKIGYLSKKGIHYINSKAEDIIEDLLLHLKENIISDLENSKISADTFRNFLANVDLLPELKADINSYKVSSIKGNKENIQGTMNLKFKNDANFINEFNEYIDGKKFGKFEISKDILINMDVWYGGIKFPNLEDIAKIELNSKPRIISKIDIRFENGFEFSNVPIKIYGSLIFIEIHLELDNAEITVGVALENKPEHKVKLNYKHKNVCKNVKSEIELFTFLKNLSEGKSFEIYSESEFTISNSFPKSSKLFEQSIFFLDYFEKLKKIETTYNCRFSNIHINDINDLTINSVNYIVSIINEGFVVSDWHEELSITLVEDYTDEVVEQFKNSNNNTPLIAHHNIQEILDLHGRQINLGYKKIEFYDIYVLNIKDVAERIDNTLRIKTKSKKIHISYTKDMVEEITNLFP